MNPLLGTAPTAYDPSKAFAYNMASSLPNTSLFPQQSFSPAYETLPIHGYDSQKIFQAHAETSPQLFFQPMNPYYPYSLLLRI